MTITIPQANPPSENGANAQAGPGLVALIDYRLAIERGATFKLDDKAVLATAFDVHVHALDARGQVRPLTDVTLRLPAVPIVDDRVVVVTDEGDVVGRLKRFGPRFIEVSSGESSEARRIRWRQVRQLRALGIRPEVRFRVPSDSEHRQNRGERGLGDAVVEVLYQATGLWWNASYAIEAKTGQTGSDGRVSLSAMVKTTLMVHNKTGRAIPEADMRLVDRTSGSVIWRERRAFEDTLDTWTLHEGDGVAIPGTLEYVIRTGPADSTEPAHGGATVNTTVPFVGRELILRPPPDHVLWRSPSGWALVRLPRNEGPAEYAEGQVTRANRDVGGLRIELGSTKDILVRQDQHTTVRRDGLYRLHKITVQNRSEATMSVRILAAVQNAGIVEIVRAEPTPTRRDSAEMTFRLTVPASETQEVSYLIYHPR